jgi:hypothetical protein
MTSAAELLDRVAFVSQASENSALSAADVLALQQTFREVRDSRE